MHANLTEERRRQIAAETGTSDAYLYQCLTGRKQMRPDKAVDLEVQTGGELRRWQLRQGDWHRIWPEFIGQPGAPRVRKPIARKAA